MRFDEQGHLCLSPQEFEEKLSDRRLLINCGLIPEVPKVFEERDAYDRFLEWVSDALRIHPRNFVVRGSGLLGYSVAPERRKLWREMSPRSDIDLAIVDGDYYHLVDREVRYLEFREGLEASDNQRKRRRRTRGAYYYRYMNLPGAPAVDAQRKVLSTPPSYIHRSVDAFVFRDWWSLFDKWDRELRDLTKLIQNDESLHGGSESRSSVH